MSNQQFLTYISTKLMEDLRSGIIPEPEIINGFVDFDTIAEITALVQPTDKQLIVKLCNSSDSLHIRLGISMSRGLNPDPELKKILIELWQSQQDFLIKSHLPFWLLDYNEESDQFNQIRKDIYAFIQQNYEDWIKVRLEKFFKKGRTKALEQLEERLNNDFFPPSKTFLYLCLYPALAYTNKEKEDVKKILSQYLDNSDPLTNCVANDMLMKLNQEVS